MSLCAAIQMVSTPDVSSNLASAERLIKEAAAAGAKLIALPENFALMSEDVMAKIKHREPEGQGPIQQFLSETAKKYAVWLIGGTIPLAGAVENKVRAACLMYNDQGQLVSRYDKIHLFDVDVPNSNEVYRESDTIEAGNRRVVSPTPFGILGFSVCYDVRFPELYRAMHTQGVQILTVPSAFTAHTGAAHWETLLRARAIENLCYVIAPNQGGSHANGRQTFGHSMIIDPWGQVLSSHFQGEGFACAEINLDKLAKIRAQFPALNHIRL